MKRITVILAGGQSQRMGGEDKARLRLYDKRLIDHVVSRLQPQTDRLVISGEHDYGAGLLVVPDLDDAPKGPAGAIYSIHRWLMIHEPNVSAFCAAPVDGPFAPDNLVARFSKTGETAIASDGSQAHPTFGYWRLSDLEAAWPELQDQQSISLMALASACNAQHINWEDSACFFNINAPEDLTIATNTLRRQSPLYK